jgi:uncharacterized protein (TIGR02246 family)
MMRIIMMGAVAGAMVMGGAGAARADRDGDAVRAVVDQQIKAMAASDETAFADTCAADALVMLPGGYARGPAAIGKTVHVWLSSPLVEVVQLDRAVIGRAGDVAWVTADVTMSAVPSDSETRFQMRVRATELLTRDRGGWKVRAAFVSQGKKDDPTHWNAVLPAERVPGDEAAATAPLVAWLGKPADLAAHLHAGDDVIVLGSDAAERGAGAAAARLLGGWKKLAFTPQWVRAGGDGKTFAWVAARVVRKVTIKGLAHPIDEPYWVLALAIQGAAGWELVGVHYGQDPPEVMQP